jgi:hypothetical protein
VDDIGLNRWYDKYPELKRYLEQLQNLNDTRRDRILNGVKEIIMEYDNQLVDRHVIDFPMATKRRWYDKDPYSWLAINSLQFVNEELLEKIMNYFKEKMG